VIYGRRGRIITGKIIVVSRGNRTLYCIFVRLGASRRRNSWGHKSVPPVLSANNALSSFLLSPTHAAPFIWSDVRGYVHCTAETAGKKRSKKELKQIEMQNAQGERMTNCG